MTMEDRYERMVAAYEGEGPAPGRFGILVQDMHQLSGCPKGQAWFSTVPELLEVVFEYLPAWEGGDEDELQERLAALAPLRPKYSTPDVLTLELLETLGEHVSDALHWWGRFEALLDLDHELVAEAREAFWEERALDDEDGDEDGDDDASEGSGRPIPPELADDFAEFLNEWWRAG